MAHELEIEIVYKDPSAVLDYGIDWSENLVDDDVIDTSTWEVSPGITAGIDSHTDTATILWLSGGTASHAYTITNQIVTTGGRTDQRSMIIKVENR